VPQKVRFRYKLEGRNAEWQDVGTRRQAFFSDLSPGPYTFRVIASNNDGVWNNTGASWGFNIAPAFYQTLWFQTSVALAGVGLILFASRLRLRQITARAEFRYAERLSERTRIARELHDTLLQSLQGLLLDFHSLTYMLPDRPVEAREALGTVIENARQAITEGRNAVDGLRPLQHEGSPLELTVNKLGLDLASHCHEEASPNFDVRVEGVQRTLAPIVGAEVDRIAIEAVRNAFLHAHAQHIEVEIGYHAKEFRLLVRDNGRGIGAAILQDGRNGHYGVTGMHERARLLRGKLDLRSEIGSGTEVELRVPASRAYAKGTDSRTTLFSVSALVLKLRRSLW
jgi:signal transduction histidine kinase